MLDETPCWRFGYYLSPDFLKGQIDSLVSACWHGTSARMIPFWFGLLGPAQSK
jgi:hypothetical protein